ncbi:MULTISPECIES: hypothetical protein [unclassified Oceanispirochaeta]|uniref:hypothetical protein n=1 Tax=unclassified Oceanispirochaeta TaxID=2635722 RepID=UPI000E09345E|nr:MULTISPECIES: hypothetical protein [unclassified Oceanispirochaeta]MBF9017738.1 hypothetical protein [Oceanispirochaeta sp. M2]NPD72141.1 hypothetical protein [Oceanispirochaeta sp. M1]RDG32582.1 hypothetical protein DV872_08505 [Oceanispirochaeta sp. M1]
MNEREKLISSINDLFTELKDEELKFILKQAEVLDYNRKVRLKREEAREQKTEEEAGSEAEPVQSAKVPEVQPPVYIEQTDRSKFFNICIGTARLFVDYQEIQALFKIASAAGSAEEGAPRLYRWFQKERSDVLAEGNIRSPGSPALYEIYEALLETFTSS